MLWEFIAQEDPEMITETVPGWETGYTLLALSIGVTLLVALGGFFFTWLTVRSGQKHQENLQVKQFQEERYRSREDDLYRTLGEMRSLLFNSQPVSHQVPGPDAPDGLLESWERHQDGMREAVERLQEILDRCHWMTTVAPNDEIQAAVDGFEVKVREAAGLYKWERRGNFKEDEGVSERLEVISSAWHEAKQAHDDLTTAIKKS